MASMVEARGGRRGGSRGRGGFSRHSPAAAGGFSSRRAARQPTRQAKPRQETRREQPRNSGDRDDAREDVRDDARGDACDDVREDAYDGVRDDACEDSPSMQRKTRAVKRTHAWSGNTEVGRIAGCLARFPRSGALVAVDRSARPAIHFSGKQRIPGDHVSARYQQSPVKPLCKAAWWLPPQTPP